MEKFKVEVKGTRPLLMCSPKSLGESQNSQRGRKSVSAREEAESLLYLTDDGKPYVSSLVILAAMRKQAVNHKIPGRGHKTYKDYVYAGLEIEPDEIELQSSSGWIIDSRSAVIGTARIMKARPKFKDWKLEFQVTILDEIITPEILKILLEEAGKFSGLLDFRPLFGRFEVTKFERII